MNALKKYPLPLISSIFLTVLPIIFSSVITYLTLTHQQDIENFTAWQWAGLTTVCCFTSMIALTPPTFLALIFGYFLGWNAILPVFVLNMVAIYLVNMLTRLMNREKFIEYLSENKKVKAILDSIRNDEFKIIFFTKLSPVLPFALMNLVFSLSGAKLKNILWGGFLGMIPRTLLAIWTASQAKEIRKLLENPNEGSTEKIVIILLVVASIAGIVYFFSKNLTKSK